MITEQVPFFSIIIPIYNAEEYIINTLKSVNNQNFNDFEVIIIDDGSTDESAHIVQKYILEECRFKINLIRQENKGVSVARNIGIEASSGKYIVFLDADDLLHPLFLSIFRKYQKDNSVFFCGLIREQQKFLKPLKIRSHHLHFLDSIELYRSFLYQSKKCGFTTFVYEKRILIEQNIFFTEGAKYAEDMEFICKYLSFFKEGIYFDLPLYFYRKNLKSAMSVVNKDMEQALQVMMRIENFLAINKVDFYYEFRKYMFSRELLSLAYRYAYLNKKDYYKNLCENHDIRHRMQILLSYPSLKVKLSAIAIIYSPRLFFHLVRWSKV